MRKCLSLIAFGLVLTLSSVLLPARADDSTPPADKLRCLLGWAFPECNEGFSLCTVLNAECVYCPTPTTEQIRVCRTVEESFTCKEKIQNGEGQMLVWCGNKKQGTCVKNTQGGLSCQSVVVGNCGAIYHRCSP